MHRERDGNGLSDPVNRAYHSGYRKKEKEGKPRVFGVSFWGWSGRGSGWRGVNAK